MSGKRLLALATGALLVASVSIIAAPTLVNAAVFTQSCGSGWFTPNACKYDQAKYAVSGNCGDGNGCTISTVYWKGGTASGSCDPSNDITAWRLFKLEIKRVGDGKVLWEHSGQLQTNCDVNTRTFSRTPGVSVNVDVKIIYQWVFNSSVPTHAFVDQGHFLVTVR